MKKLEPQIRDKHEIRHWRKKAVRFLAGVVVFATTYALILPAITLEHDTAEELPGIVLSESYLDAADAAEEIVTYVEEALPAEETAAEEASVSDESAAAVEEPEVVETAPAPEESASEKAAPVDETVSADGETMPAEDMSDAEEIPGEDVPADISGEDVPAAEPAAEQTEEIPVEVIANTEDISGEDAPADASEEDTLADITEEDVLTEEPVSEEAEDIPAEDGASEEPEYIDEIDEIDEDSSVPEDEELPVGDPSADVETESEWTAAFADLELTEIWAEDLLAIAESQLGYTESTRNFIVTESRSLKGYTRYGAWYGIPYGDWCAMFVSFCLHYAGIPEEDMPRFAGCSTWVRALEQAELFAAAGEYEPVPGDLIFFAFHGDVLSDHVGVVRDVYADEEGDRFIDVIEGNSSNRVQVVTYPIEDSRILGYGILPENRPAQSFAAEAGEVRVTVEADKGAFPVGTTMTAEPVENEEVLAAVESAVPGVVNAVRAVDITFFDRDGAEIEPAQPIRVYMAGAVVAEASSPVVVHVDGEGSADLVEQADVASAEDEVVFDADAFSIYAVVDAIVTEYLSADGTTYEVTVTYGPEALIPEGSSLEVTEFAEGDAAYADAYNAVLADMLSRGVAVNLDTLGFAALDISIHNAEGEEIEPAAAVQVDMKIKALPGVEDPSLVADSLSVQHHVETENGVVVEQVFAGNSDAAFTMDTNENVIASGYEVDRSIVTEEALAALRGNDAEALDEYVDYDALEASFTTEYFSTFTVTWGSASGASDLQNGAQYIIYASDASDGKIYALKPNGANDPVAVEVTIQDGLVSYSGDKNDLYWNVSTTGNGDNKRYTFSYTSGSRTYYLGAGVNNNHVIIKQTQGNYGNGQSTSWGQWSNYLHSAGDTFLQCHEGTFRVRNISGISNWMGTSNIYFEKQNPTFQEITVHYVDENYNELPSDIITGNASSALRYAYLIYDVEGYDYVRTEYKSPSASSGTSAYPLIRVSDGKILTDPGDGNSSPVYTTIPNNRDVYVVYKPRASSTTGGIPVPILDTTVSQPPEAPSVTKTSVVNGDGTNTISLTVVGHNSDIESYKLADVLIIFDRSGSMAWDMDGNDTTGDSRRIAIAKKAVNNLAHLLFQKNKPGTAFDSVIRMGLISFSNTETDEIVGFTNSESDFNTAVNGMTAGGGTNWESALSVADQMAFESERASFVIFVTDGDPTFRYSRMTETDVSIEREGVSAGSSGSYYPLYDVYGAGNSDSAGNNYQAALAYAQSIVGSDKRFYAIGISNDVTNLQDFTDDAFGLPDGEHSDHCVVAANEADLQSAFNDIGREILGLWGHSDIDVVDGITDLTQTVEKAGMVSLLPEEDNFTYYRGTVTVETKTATQADVDAGKAEHVGDEFTVEYVKDEDWSTWNPASEGCQPATYNDATGAVEWNMGNNFIPLEGYAYRVDFKVWPSQEAYDIIAQLNNGVLFMDDTNKVIKDAAGNVKYDTTIYEQIGGNLTDGYYLKTNTSAKYSYSQATVTGNKVNVVPNTESGDKTIVYDVPDLSLVTQPLKIQKEWESASSSQLENKPDQIDLELYSMDKASGSTVYRTVSLNDTNSWTNDENYVSYGLVSQTGSGLVIYEKGHDFTLRESAYYKKDSGGAMRLANNLAHYWDLSPGVYRPMVVAYESGGAKTTKKTVLERVYGDGIPSALSATTPFWHDGGAQNTSNPLYAANMKETYNTYTGDYYWLPDADGTTYHAYIDTGSDVIMLAYNKARSYVDLMKDILGPDGNPVSAPDEEFTITGTINVPTDIPYYFENGERYVFISVRGPDGSTILLNDHPNNVWKPSELYAAGHADMSEPYPGYYVEVGDYLYSVIDTTQPFTLKIKQGYSIRFLNIAEGTTFHLSEIGLDSNEYDTPSITLLARQRVYDPGTNTTSAWTVLENKTYADTTDVDYTVEELNTTYRFTYINKLKTAQKVTILKTNEDGSTALTGAKFDLYSEAGWLADPKSALKTDLETGADGKIELGYLPKGTYYLKETQAPEHYNLRETPVKIEVRDANVVYDDGTVLSTSGNGRMGNTTDGFTLKVTNSRFGSLPNTGGHGTKAFTWAGAALVLIAALGYLRRMRRKGGQSG